MTRPPPITGVPRPEIDRARADARIRVQQCRETATDPLTGVLWSEYERGDGCLVLTYESRLTSGVLFQLLAARFPNNLSVRRAARCVLERIDLDRQALLDSVPVLRPPFVRTKDTAWPNQA